MLDTDVTVLNPGLIDISQLCSKWYSDTAFLSHDKVLEGVQPVLFDGNQT